jgi:hypothetical protein
MSSKQKNVGRVVFISGLNGWSIASVGVLGGLFSLLMGGWFGFFLCLLITSSGWLELTGRSKIKQGLPEAGAWLTVSQIWLLLIIVIYAGFQLLSFDASDPLSKISPEMKDILDTQLGLDIQDIGLLVTKLYYTTYISLIAATFLYQGGLWLYYRRSSKKILSL